MMKAFSLFLLFTALAASLPVRAEGTFMDKVRRVFDSTKETVGSAAQGAGRVSRVWLAKAKENLRLSRPEYTQRADKRIAEAALAIQRVKDGKSGVMDRRYFKTRLEALEGHLAYARLEFSYLQASPVEQTFRERQRGFDFTLWSLEEAISLSESEAGF